MTSSDPMMVSTTTAPTLTTADPFSGPEGKHLEGFFQLQREISDYQTRLTHRVFRLRAEQDPDVEDVLVSLRTNMRATKHQAIMRLYRILHRELQEADAKFFVRWGVFLDAHPKAEWGSVVWAFEPSRPRIDAVRALGRLLDRELFAEPHFGKPVDEEDIPCPDELGHQDPNDIILMTAAESMPEVAALRPELGREKTKAIRGVKRVLEQEQRECGLIFTKRLTTDPPNQQRLVDTYTLHGHLNAEAAAPLWMGFSASGMS